jgi:hypothetical protein
MAGDETTSPAASERVRAPGVRRELRSVLELSGLVGFAVVQPVLGPFGESPETFVSTNATASDIVVFALVVAVVPLVALAGLGAVARLAGPRVREGVHRGLVGLLAGAAAVAIARDVGVGSAGRVVLAVVVVAGAVWAHHRWVPVRLFLRYASPVPVLLVLVFLFASPVAPLVRPEPVEGQAASTAGPSDLPPVVFIVLDELSTLSLVDGAGGIDGDAFPNLARLAATSSWYRDHTSVSPATNASLPAITTGTQPTVTADERPPTHGEYPDNLITLMARTHDVHAVEWATNLCPTTLCPPTDGEVDPEILELLEVPLADRPEPVDLLLAEARELWVSQVWPTASDYTADYALPGANDGDVASRVVLEFISGLSEPSPEAPPAFHYLHSPLPHTPWSTTPSGRTYDGPETPFGAELLRLWPTGQVGQDLADAARTRYVVQLQWTDRLLGVIMDRLQQQGLWDDAAVVVTADHGVAFRAGHHMRVADPATQVDVAWTPLFVKAPGQTDGDVVDDPVNALDVLPTVADLAGVEVPWDLDGRSLLDPIPGDRPRPMLVAEPEGFERRLDGDRVDLDADGLAAITSDPGLGPVDDDLRPWRHGRHGDLLGRRALDLGVCPGPGLEATLEVPAEWGDLVAGTQAREDPLPIWLEGTVDDDDARDLAVVVDGVVAGWSTSHPESITGERNPFGILLTAPLVEGASGAPALHEIVDEPGCRLRPVRT